MVDLGESIGGIAGDLPLSPVFLVKKKKGENYPAKSAPGENTTPLKQDIGYERDTTNQS